MNQGMNPYQAPSAQSLSQQAERDWKWLLFSFDGRVRRGEYWMGILYLSLATIVFGMVVAVAVYAFARGTGGAGSSPTPLMMIVFGVAGLAFLVPIIWAELAIIVKRFHDRNKSGLWALLLLVPYLGGLWIFVECGCLRGTEGDNAYGPDPLA